MYRTSLLGVLLHLAFCSSLPSPVGSCSAEGPEGCQFQGTYCSWSREGNFSRYHHAPNGTNFFVGLDSGAAEATLTSRVACSTQGLEHCLGFHYRFEVNGTVDLSVSVEFSGSGEAAERRELWTRSSSSGWEFALVPVKTSRDFSVVLHAERPAAGSGDSYLMYIDNVTYWKSPCSSELPLPPLPSSPPSSTSDSKVGLIVGIVVAVFVVVVIVVFVVFFVIKRKQACSGKSPTANNPGNRDNHSANEERFERSYNTHHVQSVELYELGVSSAPTTSTDSRQHTEEIGESTDDYDTPVTLKAQGTSEDNDARSNEDGTEDQVPAPLSRAHGEGEEAERNMEGSHEQFEEGTDGYQRFTAAGATDNGSERSNAQCEEDSDGYLLPVASGAHKVHDKHVQNVEEDKDIYLTPWSPEADHENGQETGRFDKSTQQSPVQVTRKRNAFFVAL